MKYASHVAHIQTPVSAFWTSLIYIFSTSVRHVNVAQTELKVTIVISRQSTAILLTNQCFQN